MVASYSGLYEEGDIEHINVPPMALPESESHIYMQGLRLLPLLPTHYKKGRSAEGGKPIYGIEFLTFSPAGKNLQKLVNRRATLAPGTSTKKVTCVHDGIHFTIK